MPPVSGFIGYWLAPYIAIVLTEHFVFRRNAWSRYDVEIAWNQPHLLPKGYAALFTFVVSIGFIVVFMEQGWWVGPVAKAGTGDIGMIMGFLCGVILFGGARWIERKYYSP